MNYPNSFLMFSVVADWLNPTCASMCSASSMIDSGEVMDVNHIQRGHAMLKNFLERP